MTYAYLCIGKSPTQIRELNALLVEKADPVAIDRMNRDSMAALGGYGSLGPPPKKD